MSKDIEFYDIRDGGFEKYTYETNRETSISSKREALIEDYLKSEGYIAVNLSVRMTKLKERLSKRDLDALDNYFEERLADVCSTGVPDILAFKYSDDADIHSPTAESIEELFFVEEKSSTSGLSMNQVAWISENVGKKVYVGFVGSFSERRN